MKNRIRQEKETVGEVGAAGIGVDSAGGSEAFDVIGTAGVGIIIGVAAL